MKRLLMVFLLCCLSLAMAAQNAEPSAAAEIVRSSLMSAQTELVFNPASARDLVLTAQIAYQNGLSELGQADFSSLVVAIKNNDQKALMRGTAQIWTGILNGAYQQLEQQLKAGNLGRAKSWLLVREYRRSSKISTPETEATLALENFKNLGLDKTLLVVQADLLGTYQARLSEALLELERNLERNFFTLSVQNAALAQGYFGILQNSYPIDKLLAVQKAFSSLVANPSPQHLTAVNTLLHGWRAAPLSELERDRKAVQLLRFLPLIAVEYARGVKTENDLTQVTRDLEITEAAAFWQGTNAAFTDLEPMLVQRDQISTREARKSLSTIGQQLEAASQKQPVALSELQSEVSNLQALLEPLIPTEWRKNASGADLDLIKEHLLQLEAALKQGAYPEAETARVSAYAILESGVEARIKFFQPQLASEIEMLFWNGSSPMGLAKIVSQKASLEEFATTHQALLQKLGEAAKLVGTDASPTATFVNALVIVFREGLEAVLILAALLGSLKRPEVRHLRRPLWIGAVAALFASAITFLVMRGIVNAFAMFGERLEAVVSVIAVVVLLIIMNWFFHNVYWNDRLAGFHKQKHSLMGVVSGQVVGLLLLGFTAIYREGFETALFLQSLVLQAGLSSVLSGTAVALIGVAVVGVLVFALQTKLPHKKMLVFTGVLICAVLWVMVGNTVHIWQVVGWLPIHAIGNGFPAALGLWFGTFATWEGLVLQSLAVAVVVGSYFVAEGLKHRAMEQKIVGA